MALMRCQQPAAGLCVLLAGVLLLQQLHGCASAGETTTLDALQFTNGFQAFKRPTLLLQR
jgi:hypothetical protein